MIGAQGQPGQCGLIFLEMALEVSMCATSQPRELVWGHRGGILKGKQVFSEKEVQGEGRTHPGDRQTAPYGATAS